MKRLLIQGNSVRLTAVALLLAVSGAGCHIIQTAAEVPAQAVRTVAPVPKKEPEFGPVEVQNMLMRFADEFSARMAFGIDKLRRGTNALDRAEGLRWKLAFGSSTCSIASGPNAIANLLDMTVFVIEARMSLEEYWQPKFFGDSARDVLESCRAAEAEVWQYVGKVLTPDQQTAFREAIREWHSKNAQPEDLLVVRTVGLALQAVQVNRADSAKRANLFGLLMLDPLAGLDPARREIASTRLFAERALFVAQRMPTLLRWQAELLSAEALGQPAVERMTAAAAQIASSADRFTRLAEQLPGQVSAERAAILEALESQERELLPVLGEARQTLAAGSQLSAELNTTLGAFDGVLRRLGVGEPDENPASETNSALFRIQDYGDAAARLEAAARQLTELLETFDRTLGENSRAQLAAQISPVVQQARDSSKGVIDYAFQKGLLFVAAVLLASLIHLVVAARLRGEGRGRKTGG